MSSPQTPVVIPFHEKLLVGAVAGVVGTTCIFPIDMVKTRLQSQKALPSGKLPYSGPIQCLRSLVAEAGVSGLYRGLIPNLMGVAPEKALKLGCNDLFREKLADENGKVSLGNSIIAGGGAGFCQVAATNPMEITKIRMQLQSTLPAAERQTLGQIVNHLGLKGLYRGVTTTWVRDVPYSFIFFPLCAVSREALADENGDIGIGANLLAGGVSGASAAGICTPMDVVKTRVQAPGGMALYGSPMGCWTKIYAEEGFSAFFKGAIPRMTVTAPLFGIAILFFELQKEYIVKSRSANPAL